MAIRINSIINQGETFINDIALQDDSGNDFNVTNYTAVAAMRKHYNAANSIAFTTSLSNGQCTLSLSSNTTASLKDGRYVYDVYLISSSNVMSRIVEGLITVKPSATYWLGWPTPAAGTDNNAISNNSF